MKKSIYKHNVYQKTTLDSTSIVKNIKLRLQFAQAQQKIGKMLPDQPILDFCCDIWRVGSEQLKARIHPAVCNRFMLVGVQ